MHNTPFYGLIGEFSGTPVSNRPSALSWIFAGQSHYRTDLLRGESRRSPAALSVGEHILLDALPKRLLLPDLLGRYQTLRFSQPLRTPQARRLPVYPQPLGDLLVVVTLGGGQDYARATHQSP